MTWIGAAQRVARCQDLDGRRLIVKRGDRAATAAEAARLGWLAGRGPAPALVDHLETDGVGWLVTTALDGSPATDAEHRFDVEATARATGQALRRFHEVPVGGCPFDRRARVRAEVAAVNVGSGLIASDRIDAAYRRVSIDRLLDDLRRRPPDEPEADLVVTHGAPTLSHLVLTADHAAGWVSLGRMGVADRHGDLATAARDVVRVVGPAGLLPLYDGYGIAAPDPARIDWYALADQLS